jgi:drug/metabolite transporter (DMT)-like permease
VTVALAQTAGLVGAVLFVALTGEPMPPTAALTWALAAGVVGLVGISALYRLLADGRMSIGSPLVAVIGAGLPVLVALLLGERLPPSDLVGIVLGLAAVVLSRSSYARPTRTAVPTAAPPACDRGGSGIALFYLLVDRAASDGAGPWWILAGARATTVGLVLVALLVARPARPAVADVTWVAVATAMAVGLGDLLGNAFFLASNAEGALSVAVVLSSLYPVTTIILARAFLHERLRGGQLIGVAAALVGVVLIAI